ncbi:MAG: elongation factor G [Candidatus Cloacimonetes bacterium]|nr:elongation factor G [Candidatus Cloacimonadota bacterium]
MKSNEMKQIRNIAFVGASGAGKTTLAEHLLFQAKATSRIGRVEEGNTVMDFDPEEINKGMSLTLSIAHFTWKNHKINLIDTPGTADFIGEQISGATAADSVAIVANAAGGFEVGLEQTLEQLSDRKNLSTVIIVNRMDNEHADFEKTLELIKENLGITPIPVVIPIGKENTFEGVIDLVKNKAYIKGSYVEIPDNMKDNASTAKLQLLEAIAETDEALLDKYLESSALSDQEIQDGLRKGLAQGQLIPAFCCSAGTEIGIIPLLDSFVDYLPSPADKDKIVALENSVEKELTCSESGPLLAYLFKSVADPVTGDIGYVRVLSGTLKSGMDVFVPEKDNKDKIGSMYYLLGKHRNEASELKAGDIGALVKLKVARSFNTITDSNSKRRFIQPALPTPVYWKTIKAVNQSDEDKIGSALTKLIDEDPTLRFELNKETLENVLSGIGELQIGMVQKKLKNRYKIETELNDPKIPYKETIMGKSDVQYKHKKQSGGRGQYGHVHFRIGPKERGEGFEFINSIVGGTIPSKYIPAVEKGVVETMQKGIIAGYQVVDIFIDCYFGSYHDVDSSELAFKLAASQALKKGFKEARPIILEPIHEVQIIIPSEYMGDVMGDVSTRRGKILGMEQKGKKQILNAHLPLSELFSYFPNLKSLTQGRGRFNQKFSHYEKLPDEVAEKVIATYQESE